MKNYTNQPLANLKNVKYIHLLTTIFGSADLAYMELISKFNEGFRFLLYVFNIYCKYAWAFTLKDKNGVAIANVFKKILDGPHRIQHIMKENLLLLKDLLEPLKTKSLNI